MTSSIRVPLDPRLATAGIRVMAIVDQTTRQLQELQVHQDPLSESLVGADLDAALAARIAQDALLAVERRTGPLARLQSGLNRKLAKLAATISNSPTPKEVAAIRAAVYSFEKLWLSVNADLPLDGSDGRSSTRPRTAGPRTGLARSETLLKHMAQAKGGRNVQRHVLAARSAQGWKSFVAYSEDTRDKIDRIRIVATACEQFPEQYVRRSEWFMGPFYYGPGFDPNQPL